MRITSAMKDLPTLAEQLSAQDLKRIAEIKLRNLSPERQLLRRLAGGTPAAKKKVTASTRKVAASPTKVWTVAERKAHGQKIRRAMKAKARSLANLPPQSGN